MTRRNRQLVPECKKALDVMKYELAEELGIVQYSVASFDTEFADELGATPAQAGRHVNWPGISTRQAGYIGGSITKRLIQQAENVLGKI